MSSFTVYEKNKYHIILRDIGYDRYQAFIIVHDGYNLAARNPMYVGNSRTSEYPTSTIVNSNFLNCENNPGKTIKDGLKRGFTILKNQIN